ncbi:MAG: ATP-binding protein [Bacteroidota bacterium]
MSEINIKRQIKASPTKEFFVYMITKDIDTIDAIIDVADNSIDGARRLRGENNLGGLYIHIQVDEDYFRISDNCGGIPIEIARNYAFLFGRSKESQGTPKSIGNFGVGMKRALFKLGNFFEIESISTNSRFKIKQDILEWLTKPEWEFQFEEEGYGENIADIPIEQTGTTIVVKELKNGIKADFALSEFRRRLQLELESKHQHFLERGIEIKINEVNLVASKPKLLNSAKIQPAYKTFCEKNDRVLVRLYAGIGDRDPSKAGWNIYCNGRLILEANTTPIVGWNRVFSNEHAWFRGYVFFDSDDTSLLPWNTTKTSVDLDLPLYKSVQLKMEEMAKPVFTFMNKVADEKKDKDSDEITSLEKAIREAELITLNNIVTNQEFNAPTPTIRSNLVSISYKRPKEEVELLKAALGLGKNNAELGRRTFDYVFRRECEDD